MHGLDHSTPNKGEGGGDILNLQGQGDITSHSGPDSPPLRGLKCGEKVGVSTSGLMQEMPSLVRTVHPSIKAELS